VNASTGSLTGAERFLARMDDSPWGPLQRVILGFLTVPTVSFLLGRHPSAPVFGASLLALLFALRATPALIRKLLPFSTALRDIWTRRRQMAKRYDSYQWRKLFWFGLGLAIRFATSGGGTRGELVLTSGCLVAGAAGMLMWHSLHRADATLREHDWIHRWAEIRRAVGMRPPARVMERERMVAESADRAESQPS
jgi:hypothetical protein